MNLRKGSKVWAEDKNLAWVAAEVTDFLAKRVQILTVTGKQVKSWCFYGAFGGLLSGFCLVFQVFVFGGVGFDCA